MKKTYQTSAAPAATDDLVMPDTVTLAMADVAETVKEGLLALAVGAGFGVMEVMMQEGVTGLCGPKGVHDPRPLRRPPRQRGRLGDPRRAPGAPAASPSAQRGRDHRGGRSDL